MTVVCPSGHVSSTSDYCDQCGERIAGAATRPHATDVLQVAEEVDTSAAPLQEPCPTCGAPRSGNDRYCEGCGYDFVAPPPDVVIDAGAVAEQLAPDADSDNGQAAAVWEAVASADRAQFERNASSVITFPPDYTERRFALTAAEVWIGRSRGRSDESVPEIDLASSPQDPGISHLHAVLQRRDDGSYTVLDLGSTNGTTVNDDPTPVDGEVGVPLADGDRIRLGAWTTITLRKR
jgi:FHA domain